MTREDTGILISGGGIAGLTAAAALGTAGFEVICVDPTPPAISESAGDADLRTTAFLQPSVAVLEAAGLWQRLAPHAAALQVMRIVDSGGAPGEARLVKDFNASEISDQPFAWNLPNWLLRREISARLTELPNVSFRPGLATTGLLTREREALVTLSDGSKISARLVIGADGRNSPVREAMGISTRDLRYGQKALVFSVTHSRPHENVSTEVHRSGGPFTMVPLPDRDGKPASSVVWMERGPEAARLAALPAEAFEAEMNLRSCGVLGEMRLATRRLVWPIISRLASKMSGERVALMAEAAHVVPPIGAQGLNMSLADLALLLKLTGSAADPGARPLLDAYHQGRHGDVSLRVGGIDLLNRASMAGAQGLRDLRAGALDLLYSLDPLRQGLMKAGLGLS
ncbi:UbiH/UbiF family hydroxylase [Pseudogemmobacter faecipullorum]|uniref:UbiH/UbiF family hydroxylase n=1 Tax=Pseudogemmobacter faecipullorum TaxID=2755041 RepID=A0ABS8CN33_9RHOB|nr:UbiH/UbiF family hydroxylase [Pseudogemmobacter faecipullorum]MCB5410578.1 UbiH/UbiF family hydroxylase [Pseudogemmobacter faecipullorum]